MLVCVCVRTCVCVCVCMRGVCVREEEGGGVTHSQSPIVSTPPADVPSMNQAPLTCPASPPPPSSRSPTATLQSVLTDANAPLARAEHGPELLIPRC